MSSMSSEDLSAKMFDYLAEIYRLGESNNRKTDYISTSALADLLHVSAPAVNRMVTKLRELGLVNHEPYQGIQLTDKGRREALVKLRRHRIAEAFLVSVMGFGWHEVFEEAHRMSSSLSDTIIERMLLMAEQPAICPHGEPIPHADGTIPAIDDVLMTQAETGVDLQVTRVLTREADRLEYIAALGLVPGSTVQVIHIAPFNGPMQLKLADEYRIIGHNLAELIRVTNPDDITQS